MKTSVTRPATFLPRYALYGIVLVALVLRSVGFTGPFVGSRDWQSSFYALVGSGRSLGTYDKWPPLTEAMYAVAVSVFGAEEWSVRILPVLLSLGTVVLLYFFLRDLFGTRLAAIGSAFLAVSPGDVYYSSIVSYHFFLVLAMWMFFRWASTGSTWTASLACGAVVVGTGFNYSALPIILMPVAYLSIVLRSCRRALVLASLAVGAILLWFGYVRIAGSFSDLRLGVAADNPFWLFARENQAEWVRMAATFVWQMATPPVVVLSAFWLLALTFRAADRAHRLGDGVILSWLTGVILWSMTTPRHAATHDIWWIVALPPLAAAAARGLFEAAKLRIFKPWVLGVVSIIFLAFSVSYSSQRAIRQYWAVTYLDEIIGKILRPYVPGGFVVADSPAVIWYMGAQGYIWKYFAQVGGEGALKTVLAAHRPSVVLAYDALSRDWRFWGDEPPYAEQWLAHFGYQAAWRMWNVRVYFRQDPGNIVLPVRWRRIPLGAAAWIVYQPLGAVPILQASTSAPAKNGVNVTKSSPVESILYQSFPVAESNHYFLGGLVDARNLRGEVRVQVSFLDSRGKWIMWEDSPSIGSGQGPRILAVAGTAPLGASRVQANIRISGEGKAVLTDVTLFRLDSWDGRARVFKGQSSESAIGLLRKRFVGHGW